MYPPYTIYIIRTTSYLLRIELFLMANFEVIDCHCCIIESHSDLVPFLYSLMRAKKLPMKDLLLMHFDAHPDLMPTSTPYSFKDTETPELFFEILQEGSGGISEFILPLIYHKYISEGATPP